MVQDFAWRIDFLEDPFAADDLNFPRREKTKAFMTA
jgi:hypothetical protein